LTARVAVAPDVSNALTLPTPSNLGPVRIDPLSYAPTPSVVAQARQRPLNDMQESLLKLAANLPSKAVGASPAAITAHVAQTTVQQKEAPDPAKASAGAAAAFVKDKLGDFFTPAP
jgi:hypothetical protein